MTEQEAKQVIFDHVVKHARSMPGKSWSVVNGCVYRAEDGNRCFIGALIPDHLYKPSMDMYPYNDVDDVYKRIGIRLDNQSEKFLQHLQSIHDINEPDSWEYKFNCFAKTYSLEYSHG